MSTPFRPDSGDERRLQVTLDERERRLHAVMQAQFDSLRREVHRAIRSTDPRQSRIWSCIECILAAMTLGLACRDQPDFSNVKWAAAALAATTIIRIIRGD